MAYKIHNIFLENIEHILIEYTDGISEPMILKGPIGIGLDGIYNICKEKTDSNMDEVLVDYMDLCIADGHACSLSMLKSLVKANEHFTKSYDFKLGLSSETKEIPKSSLEELMQFIESNPIKYTYESETLVGSAIATLDYAFNRISDGKDKPAKLKRCKHCNRIFLAFHDNELYCEYPPSDSDKKAKKMLCRAAAAYEKSKRREDPLAQMMYDLKRIRYNIYDNLYRNSPDGKWLTVRKDFQSEWAVLLTDIDSGMKSYQDGIDWLESLKKSRKEK